MTKLSTFLDRISADPKAGPLAQALPRSLSLGTVGPFPLSRMTDLTDTGTDAPFDSGELRIELSDVTVGAIAVQAATTTTSADGTAGTLTLDLAPMTLRGAYRLYALEQPRVDIDTGGGLMALSALGAGDDDPATMTVEQYDQLCQANDQRERLKTTANGQKLLTTYNTYNDAYNQVFQTNRILRGYWKADGATSEMAAHTSDALKTGNTINPDASTATFGTTKVSYNYNAFSQQIHVASACHAANQPDAATAVFQFATGVQSNTNNSQTTTKPMTGEHVFQTVADAPADSFSPPLKDAAKTAPHVKLGHAVARVAGNQHDDTHLDTLRSHGYDVTDEMITAIQAIYAEGLRQAHPTSQAALWDGSLSATIAAARFVFSFTTHDGVVATTVTSHTMAPPELDLDTAAWAGTAGTLARKRLASAQFLRSLLTARISNRVEHAIADSAAGQGDAGE